MPFKSVTALSMIAPTLLAASTVYAQGAPPSSPDPTPPATMADPAPPAPPPPMPPAPPAAPASWFVRPAILLPFGEGGAWKLQIYGFAEADYMYDSTRSFADGLNSNIITRPVTGAGAPTRAYNNGRTQFTARNSRIGFEIRAPEIDGVKASGKIEGDFFGYDPGPPTQSETYINNPTFRIRHAYVKLETKYVDMLAGQMYHLFGWQNSFLICSAAFLGIPNEAFGRTQQLRLSRVFKSDDINVEVGVAAFRPVQRDSATPDGEGGLRVLFNKWKGITTPGSGGTGASPAAVGVSGLVRQFNVENFMAVPNGSVKKTGWAVAAQALIPIVSAKDSFDRSNAFTFLGEFTIGSGYADQFTGLSGGATQPALPVTTPPTTGTYTPDVDNGLVAFSANDGALHTIDWRTFVLGLQYYVPPGRVILAANFSQGDSKNMASLFPTGTVIKQSRYADGNVFFDTSPSSRIGLSYQYLRQVYTDNVHGTNNRFEALALYFF